MTIRCRCVWNRKHFWNKRYMFAGLIEEGEQVHVWRVWDMYEIPRLPQVNAITGRALEAIEVRELPPDFHEYCKWLSIGAVEIVEVETVLETWFWLLKHHPHIP